MSKKKSKKDQGGNARREKFVAPLLLLASLLVSFLIWLIGQI